jgi:hypothetical protein
MKRIFLLWIISFSWLIIYFCLVFLSKLLLGESDTANKVLQDASLVSEKTFVLFPDHLSTAILEEKLVIWNDLESISTTMRGFVSQA